ncbi:phosphoglycerate kinase [SAR116 cluster bacterium]|nr:phosphoglycerate kinase [SAR116 cluster bacterium]
MEDKSILNIDTNNKRLLIRADLNVPINNNKISDETRIERFCSGISKLLKKKAKIIIITHLGRPKGKEDLSLSNKILLKPLKKYLNKEIIFSSNPISTVAIENSKKLKNNQILLCENIRFHPEEEEDDPIFAEKLSSLGDIYVNDAFSCCHRAHSSTHSITNFLPSYFGPMLCEEISALNRTLENPSKPSLAIIGGSKVSTKISVLKNLVLKLDSIIIGGGMANTFLFAKGAPMGNSLYEPDLKDTANEILTFSKQNNCNILLPVDIITANKLEKNIKTNTSNYNECPSNQMILDVGQKSIELFKQAINSSKTILWNGPLGAFEIKPFDNSTNLLAKFTGQNTLLEKCISVAGGGDTVSALNSVKVTQQFSYVSSAGGAFLEWLEGKKLPGIEAIKSSKRII